MGEGDKNDSTSVWVWGAHLSVVFASSAFGGAWQSQEVWCLLFTGSPRHAFGVPREDGCGGLFGMTENGAGMTGTGGGAYKS